MGWLFGHYDRKSLVNHLLYGNGVKTLKHCFKGNNMWAVQEYQREGMKHPVRFICLYMLQGNPRTKNDPCNWGYKDVDETAGPYQISCPVGYIELVEAHEKEFGYEPTSYAPEWRKSVRAAAEKKARKFVPGQRLKLYGNEYDVLADLGRNKYRVVGHSDSVRGNTYTLPARMIKDAEVVA